MHKILTALALAAILTNAAMAAPRQTAPRQAAPHQATPHQAAPRTGAHPHVTVRRHSVPARRPGVAVIIGGYYYAPNYYYGPYAYVPEPFYGEPAPRDKCWIVTDDWRGYGYYGPCDKDKAAQ